MSRARRVATVVVATLLGALVPLLVVGFLRADRPDPIRAGTTSELELPSGREVRAPAAPERKRAEPEGDDGIDAGPATLPQPSRQAVPASLTIPGLELRMSVAAYGVDRDGLMALPDTPRSLAWYRFGPDPWSPRGAAVIAGHVDTAEDGTGPLARLGSLVPGDEVLVDARRRDPVAYRVVTVRRVAKSVLDLPALFSRRGPPRLHLVTCGGAFLPEVGGYQDNVVVVARRVG